MTLIFLIFGVRGKDKLYISKKVGVSTFLNIVFFFSKGYFEILKPSHQLLKHQGIKVELDTVVLSQSLDYAFYTLDFF